MHPGCMHPLDEHVVIAHGDPLDGGVMVCPVAGCVCVSRWDVPQARGDVARRRHVTALSALQRAYRELVVRQALPITCSGCGAVTWDARRVGRDTCMECRPVVEEGTELDWFHPEVERRDHPAMDDYIEIVDDRDLGSRG